MKLRTSLPLALLLSLAPGLVSAELVEAFDFTNNGAGWTIIPLDLGYSHTFELDGDPSKYGYETNTDSTAGIFMFREAFAPVGFKMSDVRLEAKVSGFSSWVMIGRIGLANGAANCTACCPYWTGTDHMSGVVTTDEPFVLDTSGDASFTGISSVWVHTEVHKGLAGVYQRPDVSDIRLYATLTSTDPSLQPVEFSNVNLDDVVGLSFTGQVDKLYLLQYTPDLVSLDWLDTQMFVRGTGGESFVFDPTGVSTQKNYRIVEALP